MGAKSGCGLVGPSGTAAWLVFALIGPAVGQVTTRVSVATGGAQGTGTSLSPSISADGRYVAFHSFASNLVSGDTNVAYDVFVHDRQRGTTERVSIATGGTEANDESTYPSISADGRYVAFRSLATNLVSGDSNLSYDVFVHDRQSDTTERVSVATGGAQGNSHSWKAALSTDGRYVTFHSSASNLVTGDTNFSYDVFVHDRQSGETERVSVATGGAQGNGVSWIPSISADGRYVIFESHASNLVIGDSNAASDVFVHDRQSGATERMSVATGGTEGNGDSREPSISADGRYVTFWSTASNLVAGDTNVHWDVFLHDRQFGTTERVSVATGGAEGNQDSRRSSISADGRYVAFHSFATNLVSGDTNVAHDVFVRDRQRGTTDRASVATDGTEGDGDSEELAISADGRYVAFQSYASNVVAGDTNSAPDVFVRDREAPTSFAPACFGDGTGAACGCGNEATARSDGGCANAAPMPVGQGAVLSASGTSSTAADDLVLMVDFTTNQPGLFFQGNNVIGGGVGVTFGDGIRCCGGSVVRLEIADPPGAAGPKTTSSTQPILATSPTGTTTAGDTRCYQWWYRNPGTSPCGSNFNLSNAVIVTWVR